MIALLKGTLELRDDPYIIVDVGGVGYRALVSHTVLSKCVVGEKIKVFTYTHVREDTLELYGFLEPQDLKLFEYLIGVSGVGPKTAINIFSFGSRADIVDAIVKGNVSFFTAVPRLGRKNAQKIIIELKSKFGSKNDLDLNSEEIAQSTEVVEALKTFGFTQAEVFTALKEIPSEGLTTAEKIKQALKFLGR